MAAITSVPTMRTWVAGELVTAAYMNTNIRDAGGFLLARPMAVLRQAAAQSLAHGSWVPVLFDTEDLDRDAGHSTVSNTSRYTAQTPGYYLLAYTATFAVNSTGRRWARIRTNGADSGATAAGRVVGNATTVDLAHSGSGVLYLNGTSDYVETVVYQDSGGALNTYIAADAAPRLQVLWVSS